MGCDWCSVLLFSLKSFTHAYFVFNSGSPRAKIAKEVDCGLKVNLGFDRKIDATQCCKLSISKKNCLVVKYKCLLRRTRRFLNALTCASIQLKMSTCLQLVGTSACVHSSMCHEQVLNQCNTSIGVTIVSVCCLVGGNWRRHLASYLFAQYWINKSWWRSCKVAWERVTWWTWIRWQILASLREISSFERSVVKKEMSGDNCLFLTFR